MEEVLLNIRDVNQFILWNNTSESRNARTFHWSILNLQTYQNGVEKSQCISIQCGGHTISLPIGLESYARAYARAFKGLWEAKWPQWHSWRSQHKFKTELIVRISECSQSWSSRMPKRDDFRCSWKDLNDSKWSEMKESDSWPLLLRVNLSQFDQILLHEFPN